MTGLSSALQQLFSKREFHSSNKTQFCGKYQQMRGKLHVPLLPAQPHPSDFIQLLNIPRSWCEKKMRATSCARKRWLGKSCIVSLSARLLYVSLKWINLKQAIRNSLKLLVYIIMQSATCLNIPEQGKAKQYTRVM